MATIFAPVYSLKTGWIVGKIEDYTAKPLVNDQVQIACDFLNKHSIAPYQTLRGERTDYHHIYVDAEDLKVILKDDVSKKRFINWLADEVYPTLRKV